MIREGKTQQMVVVSRTASVYCQGNSALKTRLPKRVCFNSADNVSVWHNKTRESTERQREETQAESRDRDKQRVELREVGCHSKKSRGDTQ